MNIEDYEFSDPNFDGCGVDGGDVCIYVSTQSDLYGPTSITLEKLDVIALAKHFKLASDDLIKE